MYNRKRLLAGAGSLAMVAPIIAGAMNVPAARAQTAPEAPKFEVASIKPNQTTDPPTSNFPLGPGDVYVRNGGYLSATGFPLTTYIAFAYKIIGNQSQYLLPQLPDWAKTERFDIQARADGDPGKDQMRLMMRTLLADRFKLAMHYENREVPVLAFVLAKSGKTGPGLRLHAQGSPCPTEQPAVSTPAVVDGLPAFCNGIYPLPPSVPGRIRFGGRNVTVGFIADTFSAGTNLGRPLIDQTGLDGKVDFTLEWMPERRDAPPGVVDGERPDPQGPSFEAALREQLGIKLQSERGTVSVLTVDHVERPSAN
jgi:uncharacterized protein (TIGR03435 family)